MRSIVIAGAGLAGFRVARALRDNGFDGQVTIVGKEHHLPYDRPPLSKKVLSGEMDADECRLPGEVDDITWRLGSAVTGLNLKDHAVETANGAEIPYDDLVIATGRRARPWSQPVPHSGIFMLRNLDDPLLLSKTVAEGTPIVIVGAGFVGCEAAATLRARGADVTVVDTSATPMPVIGPAAGEYARSIHESRGVSWRLGAQVSSIEGDNEVEAVLLSTGERLPAKAVLISIGSIPNTGWVGPGIATTAGTVHVDRFCRAVDHADTPVDRVWAAGDVASWLHPHAGRHVCVEHWSNARDMADVVAHNIITNAADRIGLASSPAFWSDQYEIRIKSAGLVGAADEHIVISHEPDKQSMLVEARKNGEVVGAIGFNETRAILKYQRNLRASAV